MPHVQMSSFRCLSYIMINFRPVLIETLVSRGYQKVTFPILFEIARPLPQITPYSSHGKCFVMNESTRPEGIIVIHMSTINSRIEEKNNQLQEAIKKSVSP